MSISECLNSDQSGINTILHSVNSFYCAIKSAKNAGVVDGLSVRIFIAGQTWEQDATQPTLRPCVMLTIDGGTHILCLPLNGVTA